MIHITQLISRLDEPNRSKCKQLFEDNEKRIRAAWGSSHNHQAWPGGYIDHIEQVMNFALHLYATMSSEFHKLPFSLADARLVLFLHDLEKPWKPASGWNSKVERHTVRRELIDKYAITLTTEQNNALKYVEGEGDDYDNKYRVMNEMGAFCHMCDVASARIWHSYSENGFKE